MADSRAAAPAAADDTAADTRAKDDARDARLARKARGGDARAFEELLGRHESRVLRLLRLLGVRDQDREDVAQDVFVRVFRHIGRFRSGGTFGGWVYRIAVNSAHDHRARAGRRGAVERTVDPEAASQEPHDPGPGPEAEYHHRAAARHLERAIGTLSDRERDVFVLCRVEELETREVARILGISQITVRRHLGRARDRLREKLAGTEKKR